MANIVELQPAFVLHNRLYQNTSLIMDVLTRDYGRVSILAKGVRRKSSRTSGILQPFIPLLVSWSAGRSDLYVLRQAEANGSLLQLSQRALLSGLYLNELLTRLLHQHDPHQAIFYNYQSTIDQLRERVKEEICLRLFEKSFLHELGFGLPLNCDAQSAQPLQEDVYYRFDPEVGFITQLPPITSELRPWVFSGKSLLALQQEQFSEVSILADAKRLMRLAFSRLLDGKPLLSRELFVY